MTTELQDLETKVKAWFHSVELRLGIIHEAVKAPTAEPLPPSIHDVSTVGNDPTVAVELTPSEALALGQSGVENLHYYLWLRALHPDALATWCHDFLTQPNAAVTDPTVGHAIVTVGGVQYPVTNEAQGILIFLANNSGATFPIS